MVESSPSLRLALPDWLPAHEGGSVAIDWSPLLILTGSMPRPPSLQTGSSSLPQRREKLSEAFGSAGRFNPEASVAVLDGEEYWAELDRAWSYADLQTMSEKAGHILSRTGFVPGAGQHFLGQDEAGLWFVFADVEGQISPDQALDVADVGVVLGYPPVFADLPCELQRAAGGPYGKLAWAMMVLRAEACQRQQRDASWTCVGPDSSLSAAIAAGDRDTAAKHLEWLLTNAAARAWDQGAYFRAVQVSELVAEDRRKSHRDGALVSTRSLAKQERTTALLLFIRELDQTPGAQLDNMEVARRAWRAKETGDPRFASVWFPDGHQQDRPDQLAREVRALRASEARVSREETARRHQEGYRQLAQLNSASGRVN